MNRRQIEGLKIARNGMVSETSKGWKVQSQHGTGSYLVYKEGMAITKCTCPDNELRDIKCKHQWAVDFFLQKDTDSQGNVTVTKTVKITYPQDWKAYNNAQTSELELFDTLLKDLVAGIEEPPRTRGRPRLSLKETAFCAIEKVYYGLSQRRAHTLYRNSEENERISHVPHFNAIGKLLNRKDITPTLQRLLTVTALPLKGFETTFSPDSSGFRTSQFSQYAVEKYGTLHEHRWVKAHIFIGTKTNIIVSARITDEKGADCPQFEPMVMEAHDNGFTIEEIPADMGYSSRDNYNLATSIGAQAYIPFKSNSTGKARGSYTWTKMYHYFMLHRDEFMEHYHQRSNVESAFNMVKAKFGDKLKSKNWTAQQNELLCKLICHNIVVLIHEMFELGIEAKFN